LSEAPRRRYLPSRDGARLHLDSPLAEVLEDQPARQVLVRDRAFGVLIRIQGDEIPALSLREALQSMPAPARQQAARRPRTGPDPPKNRRDGVALAAG